MPEQSIQSEPISGQIIGSYQRKKPYYFPYGGQHRFPSVVTQYTNTVCQCFEIACFSSLKFAYCLTTEFYACICFSPLVRCEKLPSCIRFTTQRFLIEISASNVCVFSFSLVPLHHIPVLRSVCVSVICFPFPLRRLAFFFFQLNYWSLL